MRTLKLIGCGLLMTIIASCSSGDSSEQETDEGTETGTTTQATERNFSGKNSNWAKLVAVENRDASVHNTITFKLENT